MNDVRTPDGSCKTDNKLTEPGRFVVQVSAMREWEDPKTGINHAIFDGQVLQPAEHAGEDYGPFLPLAGARRKQSEETLANLLQACGIYEQIDVQFPGDQDITGPGPMAAIGNTIPSKCYTVTLVKSGKYLNIEKLEPTGGGQVAVMPTAVAPPAMAPAASPPPPSAPAVAPIAPAAPAA